MFNDVKLKQRLSTRYILRYMEIALFLSPTMKVIQL